MSIFRTPRMLGLFVLSGLLLAACDNATETTDADLNGTDAVLAAEIAAQALSDADEGAMADLNDLNASVSESGLGYGDGPVAQRAGAFTDRARVVLDVVVGAAVGRRGQHQLDLGGLRDLPAPGYPAHPGCLEDLAAPEVPPDQQVPADPSALPVRQ